MKNLIQNFQHFLDFGFYFMKVWYFLPIIHPNNKKKVFWNFMVIFLTLYLLFSYPIQMSFRKSLVLLFSEKTNFPFGHMINTIINGIITSFLTLDIILRLKTSYYEKGMMINSNKKIVFHYFKKGFFVDTLSILPLYFELFLRIEEIQNENFIIFIICLQSLVFLKIPEVNNCLKYFHEISHLNDNQLAIFQLAELILNIFFFVI